MDKYITSALVALLVCASPAGAGVTNLLYNGDFEVDSTAAPPPGWVRWGDSTGQTSADYTRDTTNPHAGLGCYRIHHPAGTTGYTVSDYHVGYRITTQVDKAYTITFWARSDVPMTSMFYWDCYTSIQPFVDATSAGRFPYEVTTDWQEYTFTVDEGRDFYQDEVRYMLASFKPVGNEYGLERTLWIDDVVVTERDSTEEPLIDDRTLVYDPLPHRLDPGSELVINVDADVQLGPATQEAAGVSFHRITGYGRHPYDRSTQNYNLPAGIDEALRQMKLPMTRFYGVGVESIDTPWTLELTLDKLAGLMNTYQIPKDWTVIELEPVSADFIFDASFWAQAASYSASQGYGFRYWEVANEPYTRKATAFPDEDVYVNHLKDVSDAVKAVQGDAQIGIGIWPGQPNWGNYTLKAAQGYYDFVVGHFYYSTDPFSTSFENVALSANYTRLDDILRLNALIEAYNPGADVYQVDTEWGLYGSSSSVPEPETYWRSSNIVGTMHRAVRLIYYAREGMMRGASGWEMFCRLHYPTFGFLNYMDAPDKRMMLYYLTYYFNRHCGEHALDISGTAPWYTPAGSSGPVDSGPLTPVLATLSADGSEMYFVIANGSWITSHPCTISVSNFAITSAEGTGLSQSSMDADPLVQIESDAVNPLPLTTTTDQITFSLPAHTIAFIKVVGGTAGPAGRYVFYNNCYFDGNDPGANAGDDAAIATDKTALLDGQVATFANYTSYWRGINGVMVDIPNLPGAPTASDFTFKVGNDNSPAGWASAPAPTSVTVRPGAGAGGSDRITLIWPDNAIQKQWLQVTVKATANTGLGDPDVFYFGNAIGETGNSPSDAEVTPADEIEVRNNPHTLGVNPATIADSCDFNRDSKVGPTDAIFCRNNGTSGPTALQLIVLIPNQPPTVHAGPNDSIAWPDNLAYLDGTVSDDGYPLPATLTTTWTKVSGPGWVTFGNPSVVDTNVAFAAAGVYVLQLEVHDGEMSDADTVQIDVVDLAGIFFADDFDDNNLDGWTTLAGSFATLQFLSEPGYEVHPTLANSRMRADVTNPSLSDTVYISFKIRHTFGAYPGGGDGWKQGRIWLVNDAGDGFGLYFALERIGGSGSLELMTTTGDGATETSVGDYSAPPDPGDYELQQIELVYNRLTDQVECFYEGGSMGTRGISSSYRDFTRIVVYLKTEYDGLNGQLNIDDIRIADTPVGS